LAQKVIQEMKDCLGVQESLDFLVMMVQLVFLA
jgi:hypothetical protein